MRHWIWQPVTYMFLHDVHNLTHILFNMLGLWMFGVELERQWGTRFFVKYYAITGIGAGLTHDPGLAAALPCDQRHLLLEHHRRVGRALRSAAGLRAVLSRIARS